MDPKDLGASGVRRRGAAWADGNVRYSILLRWSDDHCCYLATLPEWGARAPIPAGMGASYHEALESAEHTLELLIQQTLNDNNLMPEPFIYTGPLPQAESHP